MAETATAPLPDPHQFDEKTRRCAWCNLHEHHVDAVPYCFRPTRREEAEEIIAGKPWRMTIIGPVS